VAGKEGFEGERTARPIGSASRQEAGIVSEVGLRRSRQEVGDEVTVNPFPSSLFDSMWH